MKNQMYCFFFALLSYFMPLLLCHVHYKSHFRALIAPSDQDFNLFADILEHPLGYIGINECVSFAHMKQSSTTTPTINAFKAKPKCVLGYLTRAVLCRSQGNHASSNQESIYAKMADCESCLDFQVHKATDGGSTNLVGTDVDQCQTYCNSRSDCTTWNYDFQTRTCHAMSGTITDTIFSMDGINGEKDCKPQQEACVEFHTTYEGAILSFELERTTVGCELLCEETVGCLHWTHNTLAESYIGSCTMFSSITGKTYDPNMNSGSARDCVSPSSIEYQCIDTFVRLYEPVVDETTQNIDVSLCQRRCFENPKCKYWQLSASQLAPVYTFCQEIISYGFKGYERGTVSGTKNCAPFQLSLIYNQHSLNSKLSEVNLLNAFTCQENCAGHVECALWEFAYHGYCYLFRDPFPSASYLSFNHHLSGKKTDKISTSINMDCVTLDVTYSAPALVALTDVGMDECMDRCNTHADCDYIYWEVSTRNPWLGSACFLLDEDVAFSTTQANSYQQSVHALKGCKTLLPYPKK